MIRKRLFEPTIQPGETCGASKTYCHDYGCYEYDCDYEYSGDITCDNCIFCEIEYEDDDGSICKGRGQYHPAYSRDIQGHLHVYEYSPFRYVYFPFGSTKHHRPRNNGSPHIIDTIIRLLLRKVAKRGY